MVYEIGSFVLIIVNQRKTSRKTKKKKNKKQLKLTYKQLFFLTRSSPAISGEAAESGR